MLVEENPLILVVDDEEQIRTMLSTWLEVEGYQCETASSGEEAAKKLTDNQYALVISDINMPGMTGIDLLNHIKKKYTDIAVLMATAIGDREVAIHTLELGAYGYLIKPFEFNEMLINISNALHLRALEIENKLHRERLEELVQIRTDELEQTIERLKITEAELHTSREETINRLSMAAEFRDDDTAKHTVRMSMLCELLARKAGMPDKYCDLIRMASPMHDVGKIGVSDTILLKPGKLTAEEFKSMQRHCEIGYNILAESHSELLEMAAVIAYTHHEKYNGKGYPRGLKGEEIPYEGRIVALCDVFDALTSYRVYKNAFPIEKALDIMRPERGEHFDPELHDLFFASIDEIISIKKNFSDS